MAEMEDKPKCLPVMQESSKVSLEKEIVVEKELLVPHVLTIENVGQTTKKETDFCRSAIDGNSLKLDADIKKEIMSSVAAIKIAVDEKGNHFNLSSSEESSVLVEKKILNPLVPVVNVVHDSTIAEEKEKPLVHSSDKGHFSEQDVPVKKEILSSLVPVIKVEHAANIADEKEKPLNLSSDEGHFSEQDVPVKKEILKSFVPVIKVERKVISDKTDTISVGNLVSLLLKENPKQKGESESHERNVVFDKHSTVSSGNLLSLLLKEKPREKIDAEICEKKADYVRNDKSRNHINTSCLPMCRKRTKEETYSCSRCSKQFDGWVKYRRHFAAVHYVYLKCQICNQKFTNRSLLRHHGKEVHSIILKPFLCEICGRCFISVGKFEDHRNTHLRNKIYQCTKCEKKFFSSDQLRIHKTLVHKNNFECGYCGRIFHSKQILIKHIQSHLGQKNSQCKICNKAFVCSAALRTHMYTHTGERSFHCDICKKSFSRKQILESHMLIHMDVRAYKCDYCDKAFKMKHHLKQHLPIHKEDSTPRKR